MRAQGNKSRAALGFDEKRSVTATPYRDRMVKWALGGLAALVGVAALVSFSNRGKK